MDAPLTATGFTERTKLLFRFDSKGSSEGGRDNSLKKAFDEEEGFKHVPQKRQCFVKIFQYADGLDIFLMILGEMFAMIQGAMLPLGYLLNQPILNNMIGYEKYEDALEFKNGTLRPRNHSVPLNKSNLIRPDLVEETWPLCIEVAFIGVAIVIFSILHGTCWTIAGSRQIYRIRKLLFRSILSKDVSWFSSRPAGELNNVMFEMVRKMEDGMTSKVGVATAWLSTSLGSFIMALVIDWKVSLVTITLTPVLIISVYIIARLIRKYSTTQMFAYGKAGSIASEVLSNWRTVMAFNKQEAEVERYRGKLADVTKAGMIKFILAGTGQGIKVFLVYVIAGLTFYLGERNTNGGTLFVMFFCVFSASNTLGNALPIFGIFATALAASEKVFSVIDDLPMIDNFDEGGLQPKTLAGNIDIKDVSFCYPERPDKMVLNSFTLRIPQGKTVALVGASGCGKSTVVQLVSRLYDPLMGRILIDGIDIKDMNIRWLRQQIAIVSQEPVLFNLTIRQNICLGSKTPDAVTDAEVLRACEMANALEFIVKLPMAFETVVGERGTQLSGGQKQRIAIARALISNPKILVFDEATSALDTKSEAVVQDALDKASKGRATIIIAHRLSTVRNADTIVVVDSGSVSEFGSHDELVEKGGIYSKLIEKQLSSGSHATPEGSEHGEALPEEVAVKKIPDEEEDPTPPPSMSTSTTSLVEQEDIHEVSWFRGFVLFFEAMKLTLEWNRKETGWIVICAIISMIVGAIDPLFQIVFAYAVSSYCAHCLKDRIIFVVAVMISLGCLDIICEVIQYSLYAIIGERLVSRIRRRLLGKVLRMDPSWHDRKENQSSAMITMLASDCTDIVGASAIKLCAILAVIVVVCISVIYSAVLDWRIFLTMLPIMPLIVFSGTFGYTRVFIGSTKEEEKANKECAAIAMDAIRSMRTVITLDAQAYFLQEYSKRYLHLRNVKFRAGILASPLHSLIAASVCWARALAYGIGAYLIVQNETGVFDILCVMLLVVQAAYSIAKHFSAVSVDESKARNSVFNIARVLQNKNAIDIEDKNGESLMRKEFIDKSLANVPCEGRVEFRDVNFNYPTRPGMQVLNDINLTVEPGQFVAFCGPSGGGKSTIIQLIQRLYDPGDGGVLVDGADLRTVNVRWLRANIGIVSQEPSLFALSIKDNILYGAKSEPLPGIEEVEDISKEANAYEFVNKFPEKFDTVLGEGGALLSGGQKQRIAIARALIRKPKILILDEATSALDSESERLVQDSLDNARQGRTCLAIAHRLSTIQSADKIIVIENGHIAEQGTHEQLMRQRGVYFNMQTLQNQFTT